MANFITGIISLTLGVVLLANVFIFTVKNTSTNYACSLPNGSATTCSWTSAEIALWGLLSLVGIMGMVYGVLNVFGLA